MKKKDIFYYGTFFGIPVYFQPEEGLLTGRNWFYNILLDIVIPFLLVIKKLDQFPIKIEHKTITRQEIEGEI